VLNQSSVLFIMLSDKNPPPACSCKMIVTTLLRQCKN